MPNKDDGGPAFPARPADMEAGMTLRDYFAAQAMEALLSYMMTISRVADQTNQQLGVMVARIAYLQADAMLEERDK